MSAHFAGRFCSLVGTRALAVLALGLASAYAGAASAQELNFADNTMFQLCSGTTFPGISGGTTSDNFAGVYPSQYQQTQNSSANSLWMIEREGVWNGVVHNTTTCRTWRVNWYDNTEEEFEEWYETTDQVCDRCDGPAVGCTEADYQSPGFYWILASDSSFAHDSGWGVINQDTIADYLEFSTSLENIHLHEHGHNYGLDDVVGIATTMENVEFHYKNINLTQANNDQMWPNDNAQMRARNYEISGGSTRRNFAASVWFRNTSDGTSTRSFPSMITLSTGSPSATVSISYSFQRFFSASTGAVAVQFRWIPDSGPLPTFNWSTHSWSWPSNVSTDVWDVESVSGSYVDITQLRNWSFTVSRTDFPLLSTTYRLYMFVDPAGAFTETDEGDNMIPTQFLLTRSS